MWATASSRADRRLLGGPASSRTDHLLFAAWVAFAAINVVAMFVLPGKETVPFHFVWISLSIVYGLQSWSLTRTYLVLVAVGAVTGVALIRHVQNHVIGWEETTEVPLMSLVFLAMVWHVRRRTAANAEARALAESERRMRDAQRRFVRFASHELRTPLTVARGYTELIRDEHLDPQVGEDTAVVLDELDKLERIAARLLTLAKVEEPSQLRLAPVDLDALLHRTIKRWRPTANRQWSIDSQAGMIVADADRLEAALDSLLENAVRYTEGGGRIELRARRDDGYVSIMVGDDGVGIPAEDLNFVFEGFHSGSLRGGTGMGLAIVAAVVHSHGGTVRAENREDGGALFTLRLPTRARANGRTAPAGPASYPKKTSASA
jgi:two-component system, OmpR family, sensor kinase